MMQVGQRLYIERLRRGLGQVEVAARSGVPQSKISNIEKGRQDLTVSTLLRLCQAIGVKPGVLFDQGTAGEKAPCLSRPALERIAEYAVRGRGRLSVDERHIAGLLRIAVLRKGGKHPCRRIQLAWWDMKRLLTKSEMDALTGRMNDVIQRAG